MTDPIINVKDLHKSYGNFPAVSGISFCIPAGEFFGLLGPNGAGKTTTIGMLTGLIPPTSGEVFIDGHNLRTKPNMCKSKIGFVPQDFAFYPSLKAEDNLSFFGRIYGLKGQHLKNRIDEVLKIVTLSNHTKQPVSTYSNGMKRRLNIAIGLLNSPAIIILDEPTVGVDAQSRSAIFDSLRRLNKKGVTIIYTTHYMEEAQTLCHRVAIIDHGRIVQADAPEALVQKFSDSVVKVEFGEPVPLSLYEQLKEIGYITPLDETKRWVQLTSINPAHTVEKMLNLSEVKRIGIQSLDVSKPNLEDVFLHLTGRSLRDDEHP
jgi:ABC-2 type transport system ATP-binding protein